ncbi:hypothetical protein DES53_11035 [Roseimicrobium gellanilyticum]|uniref:Uncharacterized protein n=2 Tax=Roseimicrobium gellanilyticum TaxID=748857 RepID=A0A366H9S1_9BACT|nr:hypothetical protein DES53_11035 [Roseimicrobium gellanilyticum]
MKRFALMIAQLTPEQRKDLVAIQQLKNLENRLDGWDGFRSMSWSHVEWERSTRPRFDYVMHQNTAGISDDEAILIATPCGIRIKDGEFARVALTHALETIHIPDTEFHERILRQSKSLDGIP